MNGVTENFSNSLMNLIRFRRSVRIFNGQKIPKDEVISIIEAATWAPTGCNNQELRYYILDKEEEINSFLKFKPFLKGVSNIILIFCDMSLPMSVKMYKKLKHERNLPYIDVGLAMGHLILYAKSRGIDSCIVNVSEYHYGVEARKFNLLGKVINRFIRLIAEKLNLQSSLRNNLEYFLRKELNIPEKYKILGAVALGYAKIYPDIEKETHGGRKVKRESVEFYILNDKTKETDWRL